MILVTGGTGLVGAHLLLRLTSGGEKVRALYRNADNINKTRKLFSHYAGNADFNAIEWVQGDINDIPSLEDAFAGIDYVYHCAAHISFDPAEENKLRKVNIEGTANMVNCALAFGVKKFCHVSSVAALGDPRDGELIDEETEWNPELSHHDYALSKRGAEMEVWRGWQEGLDVVIVNPALIFGYGFWGQGSGQIFSAVKKGMYFYTEGSCGIIAVEDVVSIMTQLMNSEITGERFALVAENSTYKNLFGAICEGMGKKSPAYAATRLMTSFAWRADWLLSKLFMRKRGFTRAMARAAHKNEIFDNSKTARMLNFTFTEMKPYLKKLASQFTS
ncbi:NAD-dependent epimerase [Flavobacterium cyanobacteriorum]|uniref:NAD-dependent epimerase n=1 Tax=Flavobacterium cyanobacteriorum TaxID=2022802 RepID=A0A255ZV29_9FLAO|nr:NAD-dependent epimerase/dehydratase family protein [Flavobacterium cyanobacteriorum]OYQ45358.1 NAD-dependent epimerase [Flavobacterium cyanobacteriorum]